MPESVPWVQQSVEVRTLIDRLRAGHPGVDVDVWSPTAEERADGDVPVGYQEIVIGTTGPERYVIPLHAGEPYELWRVGVDDMPGTGELIGSHTDLAAVVESAMTAADAQTDPGRVPVSAWEAGWQPWPTVPAAIAAWSPRVHSLTSQALHGRGTLNSLTDDLPGSPAARRDRAELQAAFQQMADRLEETQQPAPVTAAVLDARASLRSGDLDATLRHLTMADDQRRSSDPHPQPAAQAGPDVSVEQQPKTAVSNAWRSDMTAAAEVRAQIYDGGAMSSVEPLRAEELDLLDRVDPAEAGLARTVQDRSVRDPSGHRRPERAVEQQSPVQDRGRVVDGSG